MVAAAVLLAVVVLSLAAPAADARITPRPQVVKNPSFESGLDFWDQLAGVADVTSSLSYSGVYSAYFVRQSAEGYARLSQMLPSGYDEYDFIARIYVPSRALGSPQTLYGAALEHDNLLVIGAGLLIDGYKCYVSVNAIDIFDIPVDCSQIVDRWNIVEVVITETSLGYRARVYVNGFMFFESIGFPPPTNRVSLLWAGEGESSYFDLIELYDLSSGSASASLDDWGHPWAVIMGEQGDPASRWWTPVPGDTPSRTLWEAVYGAQTEGASPASRA